MGLNGVVHESTFTQEKTAHSLDAIKNEAVQMKSYGRMYGSRVNRYEDWKYITRVFCLLFRLVDLPRIPHTIQVRPRTDIRSLSLTKENIGMWNRDAQAQSAEVWNDDTVIRH